MKIVVLAGGISSERNVSLVTGNCICKALIEKGHKAVLVDMFLGLENYNGSLENVFNEPDGLCGNLEIGRDEPDLEALKASRRLKSPSLFGKGVLEVCQMADIVFLGLHGACGEDGRVQAAFDLLGIRYTGAGCLSSAMAMDKAITKRFMEAVGVRTAPWTEHTYTEADVPSLAKSLKTPCVIKVVNGGSSLGLAMVKNPELLEDSLLKMLKYGNHIIVEKMLSGRELTVGILGDSYLPAVEIIPQDSPYFDYAAKYQSGGSLEICPAPIDDRQWHQMGQDAFKLFKALGLSVYARADFILDEEGNHWCLEINTLPGMTPASLLPKEAAAVGMEYGELCEKIIELSLKEIR